MKRTQLTEEEQRRILEEIGADDLYLKFHRAPMRYKDYEFDYGFYRCIHMTNYKVYVYVLLKIIWNPSANTIDDSGWYEDYDPKFLYEVKKVKVTRIECVTEKERELCTGDADFYRQAESKITEHLAVSYSS